MKKTGDILRKAREEKNLSINEVGISLKINNKVISAIEAGDISQLPAKTFLRGFVQSYAQFLKLNVNEIMDIFKEEMGTTQPQPIITDPISETGADPMVAPPHSGVKISPISDAGAEKKSQIPYQRLMISAVSIFLVLCIYFIKRTVDRYQRESVKESIDVGTPIQENESKISTALPVTEGDLEKNEPIDEKSSLVETKVVAPSQSNMSIKAPSPIIATAPNLAKPQQVETKATEKPAEKPVVKTPDHETEKPIAITEKAIEKSTEKPTEKAPPRSIEVVIEALDTVEVTYTDASGKVIEQLKLSAEQVHTIRGKRGLKISLSNGGAANIILNGKDKGVAGDLGKPATLVY